LHVLGAVDESLPLRRSDRAHRGLVEALAEAHKHEEAEHGVLERLHDARRRGVGPGLPELLEEHAAHPRAGRREELHPRRVQRLGDEVAALEPGGATRVLGPAITAGARILPARDHREHDVESRQEITHARKKRVSVQLA